MIELERRYRRLLRVLPGYYRRAWEEDMVATFLAGALPEDPEDAEFAGEYGRPDWSEVASIVALAARLRVGGSSARSLAWGEAVRRVALAGLLAHAVNALAGLGALLWLPSRFADHGVPDQGAMVWSLFGLGWVAAYLALVLGRWPQARQFAGLSLLIVAISAVVDLVVTDGAYLISHGVGLLVVAVPVLALVAFHDQAPPVRPRPWLVALPVGTVLVTVVLLATQYPGGPNLVDWPGLACAAVFTAALAYQVAPTVGWKSPSWPAALVLLAVTALVLRMMTLLDYLQHTPAPEQNPLTVAALVEAAAVVVVAVPLAVRAVRTLRTLPAAAEGVHR